MNYYRRINPIGKFGAAPNSNKDMMINIICGILIVILIIILVCCLCFNKNEDKFGNGDKVLFFDRLGCGFSGKMKEQLKIVGMKIGNLEVEVIDIENSEGSKLMQEKGLSGTPSFYNTANGKTTSGLQSVDKLLQALSGETKENFGNGDKVLFFDRLGCGFSGKMKEQLKIVGMKIGNLEVEVIDIENSEGSKLMQEKGLSGTPSFYNTANGKTTSGLQSVDKLLQALSGETKENFGDENKLLVIGDLGCPFTVKQHQVLDQNNIAFTKLESKSPEAKRHIQKSGSLGIPVLVHEGKYTVGFNDLTSLNKLGIK